MGWNKYLIILFFPISLFAQKITGYVYDKANEPLAGATVYFDGSTFGTITNIDGFFEIEKKDLNQPTLVVSFLGFETTYIQEFENFPLKINLVEKSGELEEIEITPEFFSRQELLKAFKREFLGENDFGKKCIIENEDDIYLTFKVKDKTLYAFADEPITIINQSLGYKLQFSLVKFEVNFNKVSLDKSFQRKNIFLGTCYFEDQSTNDKQLKNREKAYLGSSQHFFRTIINNQWEKQKFKIFEKGFQTNPMAHFNVEKRENYFEVNLKGGHSIILNNLQKFTKKLSVLYKNNQTDLILYDSKFTIDVFGNCSPIEQIMFNGDMANKKIGYMLPLNYGLSQNLKFEE